MTVRERGISTIQDIYDMFYDPIIASFLLFFSSLVLTLVFAFRANRVYPLNKSIIFIECYFHTAMCILRCLRCEENSSKNPRKCNKQKV